MHQVPVAHIQPMALTRRKFAVLKGVGATQRPAPRDLPSHALQEREGVRFGMPAAKNGVRLESTAPALKENA